MKEISHLKKDFIMQVGKFQRNYLNDKLHLFAEIYPRNLVIKCINPQTNEVMVTIEMKNVEKLRNLVFLKLIYKAKNESYNCIPEEVDDLLYEMMFKYWIKYTKIKKQYLFIAFNSDTDKKGNNILNLFSTLELVNCTKFLDVFECENFSTSEIFGYLNDSEVNFLNNVLNLHRDIEEVRKMEPTFCLDSYNYNMKKRIFKLERRNYYFKNSIFKIIVSNGQLTLQSEDVTEQDFPVSTGVIHEIIEYIKDEMKFPNLINPPTRHFKKLVKEHFKLHMEDARIEEKYYEIVEESGEQCLENEAAYIADIFNSVGSETRRTSNKEFKEVQTNMLCKMYKVCTPNNVWYIVVNLEASDFRMIRTTQEKKTPDEVLKILISYLEDKALCEA